MARMGGEWPRWARAAHEGNHTQAVMDQEVRDGCRPKPPPSRKGRGKGGAPGSKLRVEFSGNFSGCSVV